MAVRKSTRSRSAKRSGGHEIRTHPDTQRRMKTPAKRNASSSIHHSLKHVAQGISSSAPDRSNLLQSAIDQLRTLSRRLNVIHDVSVTVGKALRHQNAESDVDIANTVRHALSDPLFAQILQLDDLIVSLGGEPPETSP